MSNKIRELLTKLKKQTINNEIQWGKVSQQDLLSFLPPQEQRFIFYHNKYHQINFDSSFIAQHNGIYFLYVSFEQTTGKDDLDSKEFCKLFVSKEINSHYVYEVSLTEQELVTLKFYIYQNLKTDPGLSKVIDDYLNS